MRFYIWGFCSIFFVQLAAPGQTEKYLGPCDLVPSKDGATLYVASADANQVIFLDIQSGQINRAIDTPHRPTGLTLSPDGSRLYLTCAAAKSAVLAIDADRGTIKATISAGHTACGPAISSDGERLYVCNRFDNDISVIDLKAGRETARVPAVREPLAAAVTPDGKSVLVINHLPAEPADTSDVAAVLTIINTRTKHTAAIRLPAGASGLRDVCVCLDGKYAYVTHILARYELPTTQVDYGWMNANALSIIAVEQKKLIGTVLLDDKYLGAANPWGVACSDDGKWICVTHAGTHELSVIDAPALLEKLLAMPVNPDADQIGEVLYDDRNELLDYFRRLRASLKGDRSESGELYTLGSVAGVSNDLSFLNGLRRRIKLQGKGPRGIAVVGAKAYIAEYFTDTLGVVELEHESGTQAGSLALGPAPQLSIKRRGQMLFNDAELCFQHWQSCASCHPQGRMDGLNWDLINDGIGNLKNTKSLLLAHKTPPAMSSAVRASAEAAVRGGIKHILFAEASEQDAAAIDAYLKSLQAVASPYLQDEQLSAAAQRGKKLFFSDKVGCAECHPAPLYTDLKRHDISSKSPCDRRRAFDTPTLIEVWRTAPYLHDGRYGTIKELITRREHCRQQSEVALSERQVHDLIAFVLSL
jgi:YVTN family beta-propeller protein